MPQHSDPGIPTLTQRVEPTLPSVQREEPAAEPTQREDPPVLTDRADNTAQVYPETAVAPPWDDDELPVLTDVAATDRRPTAVGGTGLPPEAFSTTAPGGDATMAALRIALQAEFEQALQQALDETTTAIRARLETELPAIIERAMDKVQPG